MWISKQLKKLKLSNNLETPFSRKLSDNLETPFSRKLSDNLETPFSRKLSLAFKCACSLWSANDRKNKISRNSGLRRLCKKLPEILCKHQLQIRIRIVYWWNAETTITHQELVWTAFKTKIQKFRHSKNCCKRPKIWTMWFYHRVMHPKDAAGMANSVHLNQTAPSRALIWIYTVWPDLSVRKLMDSLWYIYTWILHF